MWWKLIGLAVLTAALIFSVIPIRTHAVVYAPMNEAPPDRGFWDLFGALYLTTGTSLLIVGILAVASFVAFKILRGHW